MKLVILPISSAAKFEEALPQLKYIIDQLETWSLKGISEENIADETITAILLAPQSVTVDKIADKVGRTESLQYTGNGVSNRTIALGFMPRFVLIVRDDTGHTFRGIGSGVASLSTWITDGAGVVSAGGTDFTGIIATGVQLGSAAGGGLSNIDTKTYSVFAVR